MRKVSVLFMAALFVFVSMSVSVQLEASNKSRQRLEQLFVWKVSDSLKLTDEEEKGLTNALETAKKQRKSASSELQSVISMMSTSEDSSLVRRYRNALKAYHDCQSTEIQLVEDVLGTERMNKYLVIKHQFADKLKAVLTQNEGEKPETRVKTLKEPQIIEE